MITPERKAFLESLKQVDVKPTSDFPKGHKLDKKWMDSCVEMATKDADSMFWKAWKGRYGRELTKTQFETACTWFYYFTFDIYIGGDCKFFESRGAAIDAYNRWVWKNVKKTSRASEAFTGRLFRLLDSIHAYT